MSVSVLSVAQTQLAAVDEAILHEKSVVSHPHNGKRVGGSRHGLWGIRKLYECDTILVCIAVAKCIRHRNREPDWNTQQMGRTKSMKTAARELDGRQGGDQTKVRRPSHVIKI